MTTMMMLQHIILRNRLISWILFGLSKGCAKGVALYGLGNRTIYKLECFHQHSLPKFSSKCYSDFKKVGLSRKFLEFLFSLLYMVVKGTPKVILTALSKRIISLKKWAKRQKGGKIRCATHFGVHVPKILQTGILFRQSPLTQGSVWWNSAKKFLEW